VKKGIIGVLFFVIFAIGFMTRIELEMFVAVPSEEFNTYWIPSTWFISLLKQAKRSNRIMDSQGLKIIMEVRLSFCLLCLLSFC
jgi:bestrophin, other